MSKIDLIGDLTEQECRDMLADVLEDVSRLTLAIKTRHPLIMGKGDGAVDTAIDLIRRCRCCDAESR